MRFWMLTCLIAVSFCGIVSSQDLSFLAFVRGSIEIDPGPSTVNYEVTLYDSSTESEITSVGGQLIDVINYRTDRYNGGAPSGHPYVDVECIITNGLGQTIFSDIVYDVESIHYLNGGAVVNFDFTDASQYYGISAPVGDPSYLTSALESSTWAEIKATN